MAILETLQILIKADASDVTKGTEEADKATKKLKTGLDDTSKSTEKVGKYFLDITRSFLGLAAAAISAGAFLGGIKGATEYGVELSKTARLLGVNVEELDAWGNAVKVNGGTAEGFQSSLHGLAEHLGSTAGVALKVLPQLADTFSKFNRAQAFVYGKSLGLDEPTILLLQQGRREVEETIRRQKELGVVTKQDSEIYLKYNAAVIDSGHAFRSFYQSLALLVLPTLTRFLDALIPVTQYFKTHTDLIKGSLIGIGIAAAIFAAPFVVANLSVIALTASLTALIGVFAVVFEDIKRYSKGLPSLTGDYTKKSPVFKKIVDFTGDYINKSYETPEGGLFGIFIKGRKNKFGISNNKENILKLDPNTALISADLLATLLQAKDVLGTADETSFNTPTYSNIFSSSAFERNNSVNTGPITIHTQATDAVGIADGIGKGIQKHFWHANNYFADGQAI